MNSKLKNGGSRVYKNCRKSSVINFARYSIKNIKVAGVVQKLVQEVEAQEVEAA
jgi:hypothetical protein